MLNVKKKIVSIFLAVLIATFTMVAPVISASAASNTYYPQEDTASLVRNPGMGWVLYVDAFDNETDPNLPAHEHPLHDAAAYWAEQDRTGASEKASILYLRVPWSALEPTEGRYAWIYDSNYKQLIQGALDRGLKLAFRVYTNSMHCYQQATPEYVKQAGARGYVNTFWTPYDNDGIFHSKFENFLDAFSAEYDNPDIVDYIDGMGLGWWGEMHNMKFYFPGINTKKDVFNWITGAYKARFKKVLLGSQQGGSYDTEAMELLSRDNGYDVLRRDSYGSPVYFNQSTKDAYVTHFYEGKPIFAENCYHHMQTRSSWWGGDGFATLRDVLSSVLYDAKYTHANTLDMRVPEDAECWMQNPDLVQDFIVNGGYRLVPIQISHPSNITNNSYVTVSHSWKNTALGRIPNHTPAWNYKYKVAFALLDTSSGQPVFTNVTNIEPSQWLKGSTYSFDSDISFGNIPDGTYDFAVAIVDTTKGSTPAINLAITDNKTAEGWHKLGRTTVSGIGSTPSSGSPMNYAPGAIASTTAGTADGTISNINDNNISTAWGSSSKINFPQYITLDLGTTAISTRKMTLFSHYGLGQGITNVDVEYWNGNSWVNAASNINITWNSNTDKKEYRNIVYPLVTTNKIRLKVNSSNYSWKKFAINELELWGFIP